MSRSIQDFSNEAYGESAALRYNIFESRTSGFAMRIAPMISAFYKKNGADKASETLLDVACGTGQLSNYFLNHSFDVVGLDSSSHMLKYARDNNDEYVKSGRAKFIEVNVSQFELEQKFGLAVCSFNGLNHLKSIKQVDSSIASIHNSLKPGGYFIFDINTQLGLKKVVENTGIEDTDEEIIVRKRIFDGERIILNASGCFLYNGDWIRYRETIRKIIIDTKKLKHSMLNNGWASVTYTAEDFITLIEDPEMENVAYVVARKRG